MAGYHHTSNWGFLSVQFPDGFRNAAFRLRAELRAFSRTPKNLQVFSDLQIYSNKLGTTFNSIIHKIKWNIHIVEYTQDSDLPPKMFVLLCRSSRSTSLYKQQHLSKNKREFQISHGFNDRNSNEIFKLFYVWFFLYLYCIFGSF